MFESIVLFDGEYYQQIKRNDMGSSKTFSLFEVEGKDTTSFFQIRLELVKFVHNNDCRN